MPNYEDGLKFSACFATAAEAREWLDDCAAEAPLTALREFPDLLTPYRLDACALVEPAAALIHAFDLLTPDRRAWCAEEAKQADLD